MKATPTVPPMADSNATGENVIHRRRADDWQPPASLTVSKSDAASWYQDDAAAVIDGRGLAHVSMALHGAQTLTALLMQAAVSREDDEGTLKLCGSVEQGILAALSACLETVEVHTLNVGASWTTSTTSEAEQQTIGKAVQSIEAARCRQAAT